MGRPKVSISVPVYNTEKYLRQCLDSLINQTLQDIEIIVVNDGSTDSSESICKEYAEKDSRIKLVSKENGGLASARQAALEISTGEYFCACDSDDWTEQTMYEELYNKAVETGADVVMCDYIEDHSTRGKTRKNCNFDSLGKKDLLNEILLGNFPHMIWNKIVRHEVFSQFNLSWEHGINQGEDLLMCMKMFSHEISVAVVPQELYHYRIVSNGDSYTHNITLSTFNQSLMVFKWAEKNCLHEKYKTGLNHMRVNLSIMGLRIKSGMTAKMYKKLIMNSLSVFDILKSEGVSPKGIVAIITKIFGYSMGRTIIRYFY